MKSGHKRFYIPLLCVVILTILLTFLLKNTVPQIITPFWMWQILFFAIINVAIYLIGLKVKSSGDVSKTTHLYMVTTVAKLVVYLAVLFAYALMFPDDAKSFIISFMIYYFCFTFFETFIKIKTNNQ